MLGFRHGVFCMYHVSWTESIHHRMITLAQPITPNECSVNRTNAHLHSGCNLSGGCQKQGGFVPILTIPNLQPCHPENLLKHIGAVHQLGWTVRRWALRNAPPGRAPAIKWTFRHPVLWRISSLMGSWRIQRWEIIMSRIQGDMAHLPRKCIP